ncbi:putative S-adenosylmethionine-dependent methyltransferase involved in cell envelope biogenesis [Elusimicrobium minutum Pei191]|uniref:Ribosomal RNA small subunit methyltransferase H n=1 Tax=Elusimicrobium minutum (strain Pei191) TaxID=445932 RepID=RSMH_ELUMP|nr:16S rRNA (cytosine(1402)-N(4))-methyltransferase RsmH [Elusimicrobium minutum]B2KE60.1 RecName: Full=Ribosomal RNA small subunit methyltransferase H; AltName: Full=16S rRNA m(4)C1402 methyltransferase; AltName: Full=rRNA (cytosine-N(4)-)-methyltransferase RsmH [Elusimicrobium minutum Pei191]ACC98806.1 putative S-adenosylmethionine-dependent methyltransferase involved in cell envelope biogenesis [Elusimicrobium minutum Pei191]
MNNWTHIPVLTKEIGQMLITDINGVYIDGTLGLGGHTKYLLGLLGKEAKIIGFDKDYNAVKMAEANVADGRLTAINLSYEAAPKVLKDLKIQGGADGVLLDLGLSSYQLDDASRGFSFMGGGPLDMRFDISGQKTAADVVNSYTAEELERIFANYGEETNARNAAAAIVRARVDKKIKTTSELANILAPVLPRRGKTHGATRVFQALRIEVNDELGTVERFIKVLPEVLKPGGRAAVITFHSLEDRIVKNIFKQMSAEGEVKLVNKHVIEPEWEEVKNNRRSRSAKLRVAEKI